MDYEKAYKEALERARSYYNNEEVRVGMTPIELEEIFPELKESEDEQSKKWILEYLYDGIRKSDEQFKGQFKAAIAWLEKQEGCEYIKKDWLEHIKQSWYKEGFIDGKYSGGTSKELTINDAAIFKEIIDFLENGTTKLQHDLTKYANWLKIQFTPIEKQGRQFSVDKLKPKFHEGEWITNGDYTWKIVDVKPLDYILQPQDGNIVDDTISHVDEQFHSFTIEDAKDGDVLSNGKMIVIFKHFEEPSYKQHIVAYIGLDNNGDIQITDSTWNLGIDKAKPATKEQRNTLMKAMKESGYEWDDEKKDLKKIEQKHTWSKEDDNMIDTTKGWLDTLCEYLKDSSSEYIPNVESCINWLKQLKQRIGG